MAIKELLIKVGLKGAGKATKDIKKVIAIIESSETPGEAKSKLIKIFNLSEKQANSVLDMPLKKLTNLERIQIKNDIKNKNVAITDMFLILMGCIFFCS